jgi:hypothetical protein
VRGLDTSGSGMRGSAAVRANAVGETLVPVLVWVFAIIVIVLPVRVVGEERVVDAIAGVLWRAVRWWAAVWTGWVRLNGVGRARGYTRSCCSCRCTGS